MQVGEAVKPYVIRNRRGFALVMLLVLIAIAGLGLAVAGPLWRERQAREREQEWLRIGELYAAALSHYVAVSPGSLKQPPEQLQQLLTDTRFVGVSRHLRRLYTDPLVPRQPWATLRDDQRRVIGVYSTSPAEPFLQAAPAGSSLQMRPGLQGYARWAFMVRLGSPASPAHPPK